MQVAPPDRERERAKRTLLILQQADTALEGWTCPASTECCRFSVTGREPWLTEAEWRLLETDIARQGRRLPATPADGTCPFLTSEGRCSVYAARPLGCRTFFCDRASGPTSYPRREVSRLPRELDALSRPAEPGDDGRARPLRSWLHAARRPRR